MTDERQAAGAHDVKVVLVNPPWITRDENVWHGIKGAMPPLSLLSLGAVLEEAGIGVEILDAHVDAMSEAQVLEALRRMKPDVVGITVMTSTAICSHQIARLAKQANPDVKVVMGGVHAHAMPEETLRSQAVDYVVRGDGEYTLLELCQGKDPETIEGLCFRKGNAVQLNPARADLMDLSVLPRYAYHLVPMGKYYPAVGAYRSLPAINMLMTRGCPGKCIFCNSADTQLRARPAELVVDEIIHLRDQYGIREIQFYDDTFTVMKKNVLEFCRLMKERKVGVSFSCFARSDCFSERMAQALKEAGCHQVMFGVESGNREMLKIIRKDIDLERTRRAVKMAQDAGLEVRCAFTFGTPGETEQTIQETLDYALSMDPDLAIFNITTPYPGTQLYAWAEDNDLLTTDDWWDYELGQSIVDMPSISRDVLRDAYERAFKVFYNRPRMYLRRLTKIRSVRHFRDSVEAFMQIFLKAHPTRRGEYRVEWLRHRRQDFFDHDFETTLRPSLIPDVLKDERLIRLKRPGADGAVGAVHAQAARSKLASQPPPPGPSHSSTP